MGRAQELQSARVFSQDQILFPDISYKAFTYPGDEEALAALKRVPGAGALLTYLHQHYSEQLTFVENHEQMVKVGPQCYASLYRLLERCCEILSLPVPDLYVTTRPVMNAYSAGHRRTCVVLHSALVDGMTADELSFVLGHELGHLKCGHSVYRQLGDLLLKSWEAASSLIPIPGLGLLRIPLILAFWEWYRRAEFTCDRAGLLCVQDSEAALSALGKLAGRVAGLEEEFSTDAMVEQAQAHHEVNKLVQVMVILNNAQNSHPFVPVRLRELRIYSQSAEYRRALRGEYDRDALGLHEGGRRLTCACGNKVNAKLNYCPECGRRTREMAPPCPPPDAVAVA